MSGKRIEVGDLGFNVIEEGSGSPVILLHGFPDTSAVWNLQIPALVDSGFRVIVPDLRGRGESHMPEGVEDYAMPHLLQDVAGIMNALDVDKAAVVGHDWGAALAWVVASFLPEQVDRLVAVSVGHPASFSRRNVHQLMMSWYMWVFKFEGVAEELFSKDNWAIFREWIGSQADPEEFIQHLSKPGRLTAGMNWYRANIRPESLVLPPPELPPITCPVLGIWSSRDWALTEKQMTDSHEFVTGPWQYERFEDAGHWIQRDQPQRFNQLLIEFLKKSF